MGTAVKESIIELVDNKDFPCVMAQSLIKQGNIKYKTINLDHSTQLSRVSKEISRWLSQEVFPDDEGLKSHFFSQVVVFDTSDDKFLKDFLYFEKWFWQLLNQMACRELNSNSWDPAVSKDPKDPGFSFSVGGRSYFLIMLHPKSPRKARRNRLPAIVFNRHSQFEALREKNMFQKVRDLIRRRDKKYSGSINPMVKDYGTASEIWQYSGRKYDSKGQCPFKKILRKFES